MLAKGLRFPTSSRTGTLIQETTMLPADYQFLEAITAEEYHQLNHHTPA